MTDKTITGIVTWLKNWFPLKSELGAVATSNNYNDLDNKPNIPSGVVVDTEMSSTSTNAVQNKVIKNALDNKSDTGHTHSQYLTSHQDISGKENSSNKTSSWNSTTNNTRYPTEKLVKDSLDGKANSTHTHTKSQITDFPTIPSKTSQLTNDSGFLTSHQSLANYYNKSETNNYDVDFILGTQTANTSAWTGKTDVISSLREGTTIFYKLPHASTSTSVTLNLTLKGGGTTGAKNVFYKNTSRVTTHFGVGQVVGLTYDGTAWYVISPSDNNSNNDNNYGGIQFKAGEALTTQTICCGKSNGQYYKVASGVVLDIRYPLIMTSSAVTSGTTTNAMYRTWYGVNIANTKSMTLTNGSQLFLEGTAYSDGKFTISSNVVTHTLTSGRYYIKVGTALSTTQIRFISDMTVYYYNGTTLKPAIKKEQIVDFLDMIYPVGSIYMSVNNVSPSTLFGGTWEQIKDKFLLACGTTYSNGATGGSADAVIVEHTHIQNEHYHTAYSSEYFVTNSNSSHSNYRVGSASSGRWVDAFENSGTFKHHEATRAETATNQTTGESGTGKNMPPYLAVNVWKRTA